MPTREMSYSKAFDVPFVLRRFGEQLLDGLGDLEAQGLVGRIKAGDDVAAAVD